MKIGYKGFNNDLQAVNGKSENRNFVYKVGETYTKSNENLKIGTDSGWHYCNNLGDVIKNQYTNIDSDRYFKIEILGNFLDSPDGCVSITNSFKIIEEISKEEVIKEYKKFIFKKVLEIVKEIQIKNPFCHVGGSIGLFLHGLWLDRWYWSDKDVDIIFPFYFKLGKELELNRSGNDFDHSILFNQTKIDVKIDNKQTYDIITYEGFDYKVSKVINILEAKLKYAKKERKHIEDIYNLLRLNRNIEESDKDIPF